MPNRKHSESKPLRFFGMTWYELLALVVIVLGSMWFGANIL